MDKRFGFNMTLNSGLKFTKLETGVLISNLRKAWGPINISLLISRVTGSFNEHLVISKH